jgi:hypothetical protein
MCATCRCLTTAKRSAPRLVWVPQKKKNSKKKADLKSGILRALALAQFLAITAGCRTPPPDPIRLDGRLLTVENRSSEDWQHVEIWLNTYYRVTVPSIPAGGRFQVPLDAFVAGFGQRFDFARAQIRDLRVTATAAGKPLELRNEFQATGLGALKDIGGRKP